MAVSFKGAHVPGDIILHAVFFYLRYGVSYRDLEEIMAERATDRSWRMDETYIRVKGHRKNPGLHAVEAPEQAGSHQVLRRAVEINGLPRKIVIDKSAANTQGIQDINRMLKHFGCPIRSRWRE